MAIYTGQYVLIPTHATTTNNYTILRKMISSEGYSFTAQANTSSYSDLMEFAIKGINSRSFNGMNSSEHRESVKKITVKFKQYRENTNSSVGFYIAGNNSSMSYQDSTHTFSQSSGSDRYLYEYVNDFSSSKVYKQPSYTASGYWIETSAVIYDTSNSYSPSGMSIGYFEESPDGFILGVGYKNSSSTNYQLGIKNLRVIIEYTTGNASGRIEYKKGTGIEGEDFTHQVVYAGSYVEVKGETYLRTGYEQTGWSETENGYLNYQLNDYGPLLSSSNTAKTLYPYWTPLSYKITYDANGGNSTPASTEVSAGTVITLPSSISRSDYYTSSSTDFQITFQSSYSGVSWSSKQVNPSKRVKYTFSKWYDGNNYYDAAYAGYTPTGDTTFTAIWSSNTTYSVTAPEITRSNASTSRKITFDSPLGGTLTFSEASQSGTIKYTFKGWYNSSSGGKLVVEDQSSYNPTAAQTIYGQWNSSTTYNGSITFPTGTREGYTLLGFSTNSSATKQDSGCEPGSSKVVSSSTYYAIWSLNDYKLSYDMNGGSGTIEEQTGGSSYTISSTIPARTGWNFKGWATDKNATASYFPGDNISLSADTVLYAVWELINYNISYILDNGTVSTANKTSYTIETSTFTLNNPTKTGYTFKGWSGPGLTGESNTTVTILKGSTGDREYKAHWTINSHQFTLGSATHVNTSGSTTSGVKDYGTTITLTATVDAGYEFAKWISSNTNLISNQSSADISFQMPDGAITMIPSVKAKSYTITYDIKTNANSESDLSNKPSDTTYSYTGETVKITSTIPERTGYTFAGWCRNSNSTSELLSSGANINQATSNITLYAVWKKNIEITYDINEGTGTTPTKQSTTIYNKNTGTYFDSFDNGSGFTKEGYKFIGWSTTKNNPSTKVSTSTIFTASTTLYALWEIQYYSLTTNIYTNGIDADNGNSISSPTLVSGSIQNGKYAYGSIVKLTATAIDPYDFESWKQNREDKGAGTVSNNNNKSECNFTITGDTTIIANFATGSISARFYCYDITSGSAIPESSTTSKVKLWVRSKAATASTYGAWEKKTFSTKMTYNDSTYIQVLIENGEEYEFNSGSGINFSYTIPSQLTDILIQSDQNFSIPCKKIKTENHIKVNDVLKTSGYIKDPYFSMDENIASIWIGDKQIMGRVPSKIYPYKEDSLLIDTLYINNQNYKFNKSYKNNTSIKKVIIPQNITTIVANYLDGCSNIRTIKFLQGSQLTSLENYCFRDNSNLLKIYFPDKLSDIGPGALWGCTRLQKVILPKTILIIQQEAFYGCSNLQSLKLNHTKITTLPYGVFSNCLKLKTIFLPKTLTTIENYVFYKCDSLEKIIYMGTIEDWNKITIASQGNNTYLNEVPIQCIDGITYTNLK